MNNLTYKKFQQAKKDKDLVQMENLYKENKILKKKRKKRG